MSISRQFVLAGDATFTIQESSGGHRTYRVQHVEANGRFEEAYFAKLMTGSDNETSFTYIGKLDPFTGQVSTTAKSKQYEGTLALRLLNRVLARVWADDHAAYEQFGYTTHHEGKCGRCGRKLTTPESVERGVGPECAEIMGLTSPAASPAPQAAAGPNLSVPAPVPAGIQQMMQELTRPQETESSVFHSDLGLRAGQWPDTIETDVQFCRGNEVTDVEGDLQYIQYTGPGGRVLTVFND